MGVRRILGSGAALVALALVGAPAASADGLLAPSGSLVYSWHGDPARGCAAVGVCGIQGVLIVRPSSPAFFFAPGHGTPMIDIGGGNGTVRVRRIESGSSGDCIDTAVWPSLGNSSLAVSWRPDGRARLTIPSVDGPSSGHCGGPRAGDLGGTLTGHTSGGKHRSFTFTGTSTFTAGPYSGTLQSTLAFRWQPNFGFSSGSGSETTYPPGGRPRTAPFEQVTLHVRMSAPAATLGFAFHGDTNPACVVFDTCAVSGSIGVSLASARSVVLLTAQRRVAHPVSRARALADFRAGRLTLSLPFGATGAIVHTTEAIGRTGGVPCSDANSAHSQLQLWLGSPFRSTARARVPMIIAADTNLSGLLRTHCPGPDVADVFGPGAGSMGGPLVLARGFTDLSELLKPHASVTATATGAFAASGYAGGRSGSVKFSLSLVKVSAGTVREPVG